MKRLNLLLICGLMCLMGCERRPTQAANEGHRAAQLKLPATANPYIGSYGWITGDDRLAQAWLNGYMDEIEKK